jgi:hypothetical protein
LLQWTAASAPRLRLRVAVNLGFSHFDFINRRFSVHLLISPPFRFLFWRHDSILARVLGRVLLLLLFAACRSARADVHQTVTGGSSLPLIKDFKQDKSSTPDQGFQARDEH